MTSATVIHINLTTKLCKDPKHEGVRRLPLTAFYKHSGGKLGRGSYCKRCVIQRAKERRSSPVPCWHKVRSVTIPEDIDPTDEELDIDPHRWDRQRYWRSRVWERYAPRVQALRPGDHRVDEVEIARWVNECMAEYLALALTRLPRARELAADIQYATSKLGDEALNEKQSLKLAMVKLAREDLEKAMELASRPVDDLGTEDLPLGVERVVKETSTEESVESPVTLATVTRLPVRPRAEPIWKLALQQREHERIYKRRASKKPHRNLAADSPPPPPPQSADAAPSVLEHELTNLIALLKD